MADPDKVRKIAEFKEQVPYAAWVWTPEDIEKADYGPAFWVRGLQRALEMLDVVKAMHENAMNAEQEDIRRLQREVEQAIRVRQEYLSQLDNNQ